MASSRFWRARFRSSRDPEKPRPWLQPFSTIDQKMYQPSVALSTESFQWVNHLLQTPPKIQSAQKPCFLEKTKMFRNSPYVSSTSSVKNFFSLLHSSRSQHWSLSIADTPCNYHTLKPLHPRNSSTPYLRKRKKNKLQFNLIPQLKAPPTIPFFL